MFTQPRYRGNESILGQTSIKRQHREQSSPVKFCHGGTQPLGANIPAPPPLARLPSQTTEGYKECSILPTLLMTLLSLFCMSSRRLYQLSDSEVTSPAKENVAMRVQRLADPKT